MSQVPEEMWYAQPSSSSYATDAETSSGDGWGGWSATLQNIMKYGVGRWIDSETRQDYGGSGVPGVMTPDQQAKIAQQQTAAKASNTKLLIIGGVVLAAVALLVLRK